MLGTDFALWKVPALHVGEFAFNVSEVLDLFADEIGDTAVLVKGFFGWTRDADGFHG